jgi:hypothetical protein
MKYALSIAIWLLAMSQVQPSFAQASAGDLVKQAIAAEGGAAALRGLSGLAVKGDAKFWEPGQSFAAGGEARFLGDATFAITWDLAKGMARTEWDRHDRQTNRGRRRFGCCELRATRHFSPRLR